MKLTVTVRTGKSETKLVSSEGAHLRVQLAAWPVKGEANIALVKFLSRHYGKPVTLVSGFTSSRKVVVVGD